MKKYPFRTLYSNDTVNTVSCISPFNSRGDKFTGGHLEAAVDETADIGVDVHMLQPGLTVVPWWKSRQYPYEEHIRWYKETYGADISDNPYVDFMLDGGDMVEVFVKRCRKRGIKPFISLRLNDSHGKEFVDQEGGGKILEIPGYALHCVNRFYRENPQFRIDPDPARVGKEFWHTRVLNWANPEVVEWMFGFIREICEGYDIDGLELDFMRHSNFFRVEDTSFEERSNIMTSFVSRVRKLLDSTESPGRHRWLAARLPCYLECYSPMGIDIPAFEAAGVEILNLSHHYHTAHQTDLAEIRKWAPKAAVHLELTHSVANVGTVPGKYDTSLFLRTTDEQFHTAAHVAYSHGAQGVSVFNFAYFREFGAPGRGPFNEPPFHIFNQIRDPGFVATRPQHYFLAASTGWAKNHGRENVLPHTFRGRSSERFRLDFCQPTGGWTRDGRLRIRARKSLAGTVWAAKLNEFLLPECNDRSQLYPTRYDEAHSCDDELLRAWRVPHRFMRNGLNFLELSLVSEGHTASIHYLEIGIS